MNYSGLNLFINNIFISKIKPRTKLRINKKSNSYVYWGGLIVLLISWLFGYAATSGQGYVSNARPIYEYCLILFIVVWFYSGDNIKKNHVLNFYGLIYIVQALYMGDRSSAFPMIILLVLTNELKIKLSYILMLGGLGAVFSNVIAAYRTSFSIQDIFNLFKNSDLLTLFASDTVTFSYYSAISIIASKDVIINPARYFIDFIGGIFFGGDFGNANVTVLTQPIYFNRGGGFYFSWFYFWFGIVGVFLGAVLLGIIIRKVSSSHKSEVKLFQIALAVMVFRWYIYTPFVMYRSILFVLSFLLVIAKTVNKLTKKDLNVLYK